MFFFFNSLAKRELKRQTNVELSPSRNQQPDPVNGQSAQRDRSREKREGRGSPPPLNRPLSFPLDPKVSTEDPSTSPSGTSSLQRYKDMGGIKEKAERWRGRQSDDSSPELRRRRSKDDFQ